LPGYLPDDEQPAPDWLRPKPAPLTLWREGHLRRSVARWPGASGRKSPRPAQTAAPAPGSIAAVISELEQCGPELSRQRAGLWGRHLFTSQDVRAWLTAGLHSGDLDLVVELRSLAVPPEAMAWVVRKETVLDRIRLRNYRARDIARMLQREGLLPPRSA